MKNIILSVVFLSSIIFISCKTEAKKDANPKVNTTVATTITTTTSFGVRGNCGMCKKTIETAANSLQGIGKAVWDVNTKKMEVAFDSTQTSLALIHKAIAASGYDTDQIASTKDSYEKLSGCCQYDQKMKLSSTSNN